MFNKMIPSDENSYYSRQIILDEIGISGQEKLRNAKVLVIGAGGLGCPVLQYISSAGVGTIGIVDDDTVAISNLHRQVLYSIDSLGLRKSEEAKRSLNKLNPFIDIHSYPVRLSVDNALSIFETYDLIVDCTDNYATRFLINDACVYLSKPLISGSIYRFEGQVSVFNYQGGPTLRCMYPNVSEEEFELNCSVSGVVGILPGIIGLLQANEVIKIVLGIGEVMSGKMLVFNAKQNSFDQFKIKRNTKIDYADFIIEGKLNANNYKINRCEANSFVKNITQQQLLNETDISAFTILDVREYGEEPLFVANGVVQIPLNELLNNINNIPTKSNLIIACKSGIRSLKAIEILEQKVETHYFQNLEDGINEQFIAKWKEKRRS